MTMFRQSKLFLGLSISQKVKQKVDDFIVVHHITLDQTRHAGTRRVVIFRVIGGK